jgi:hypothetical protein
VNSTNKKLKKAVEVKANESKTAEWERKLAAPSVEQCLFGRI